MLTPFSQTNNPCFPVTESLAFGQKIGYNSACTRDKCKILLHTCPKVVVAVFGVGQLNGLILSCSQLPTRVAKITTRFAYCCNKWASVVVGYKGGLGIATHFGLFSFFCQNFAIVLARIAQDDDCYFFVK